MIGYVIRVNIWSVATQPGGGGGGGFGYIFSIRVSILGKYTYVTRLFFKGHYWQCLT